MKGGRLLWSAVVCCRRRALPVVTSASIPPLPSAARPTTLLPFHRLFAASPHPSEWRFTAKEKRVRKSLAKDIVLLHEETGAGRCQTTSSKKKEKKEGIRWKMGTDMWKREKKEREANGSIAKDVLGGFDAKIEEIKKELADS